MQDFCNTNSFSLCAFSIILTVAYEHLKSIFHLGFNSRCFIKVYSSRNNVLHFMPFFLPEDLMNVYYESLEYLNKHSIRFLLNLLSSRIHILKISKDRLVRIFF